MAWRNWKKDLLTAYLADQLCWLLLENGYQRWSEALKQLTGQVMTGMHFIGNDDPAELASYLKQLTQSEIRILPGGCMQPLKRFCFSLIWHRITQPIKICTGERLRRLPASLRLPKGSL